VTVELSIDSVLLSDTGLLFGSVQGCPSFISTNSKEAGFVLMLTSAPNRCGGEGLVCDEH
jgi:hypothetical protein